MGKTWTTLAVGLAACTAIPPAPAPVREATLVSAGFEATWAAAIDYFSANNVPIATIEKVSGILATARLSVTRGDASEYASCGATSLGVAIFASSVVYNVLVRGDDSTSTVRVTASWSTSERQCNTKGIWESGTEEAIKLLAESG